MPIALCRFLWKPLQELRTSRNSAFLRHGVSEDQQDRLLDVSGPQERVQRHTVDQYLDAVSPTFGVLQRTVEQLVDSVPVVPLLDTPVPQMVDRLVDVLKIIDTTSSVEQVIKVPMITFQDGSRAAPRFASRSERNSWWKCPFPPLTTLRCLTRRPRRKKRWRRRKSWRCSTSQPTGSNTPASARCASAAISWRGAARQGSCSFAHGEQELHPAAFRRADRGCASAAYHG